MVAVLVVGTSRDADDPTRLARGRAAEARRVMAETSASAAKHGLTSYAHGVRTDLPTGTVTFLFTDVEGSTRLLHTLGPGHYAKALAEHRRVLREAFAAHEGIEVDTQGDAFFVAFPTATAAASAALTGKDALPEGSIPVHIGLHTGTATVTDEGYVGVECTGRLGSPRSHTAGRCSSRLRLSGCSTDRCSSTSAAIG